MNGPEHYQRAERLLVEANQAADDDRPGLANVLTRQAQAHAALAVAAATVMPATQYYFDTSAWPEAGREDVSRWADATKPARADSPTMVLGAVR